MSGFWMPFEIQPIKQAMNYSNIEHAWYSDPQWMSCLNPTYTHRPGNTGPIMSYSGDLNSRLVWISNGQNEVGLQMVWFANGFWNLEAQPFEIWTNGHHLVKNYLNPDKWPSFSKKLFEIRTKTFRFLMVRFSNGWDYSYCRSSTIWNLFFKCLQI